ncbi:hypothetical protein [Huintestinicola sp.]|uniref:hypothetical protein n=1 Tax=Huintestinicola sp. TaxID=2981661 RepID=UPI003D7C9CC1
MRTVKEAYDFVQDAVLDTPFKIMGCIDIGDSWIFHLGDSMGSFIPPAQVYKDDNIEPDFYRGDLFTDCLDEKITCTSVPLESII